VAADDDFFAIGGDSLAAMVLLADVSQAGLEVTLPLLLQKRTPAALAAALGTTRRAADLSEGVPVVFLIPGVGGDSADLGAFRADCAAEISFVVLDFPPWPQMLAPGFDMAALVRHFAAGVCASTPTGPILLAGYSLGAVIAMAVASALRDSGRDVAGLLLLDLQAVRKPRQSGRSTRMTTRARRLVVDAGRTLFVRTARRAGCHPSLVRYFVRTLARLPARRRYWIDLQIAVTLQIKTVEPWREVVYANPSLWPSVRTILFHTAFRSAVPDEDRIWRRQGCELRMVSGDHHSLLRERGEGSLRHGLGPLVSHLLVTAEAPSLPFAAD
jgi:thioesterase domain-containing protein